MTPLVPTTEQNTAPFAGWNIPALLREMLQAWIAHHQRLADAGLGGDI